MTDLPESLTITQSWNKTLLIGQPGQVDLTLAPGQTGQSTPADWQGSWVIESRLELADFAINPGGTVSEALRPGQSLRFSWQVVPLSSYPAAGTLWVYAVQVAAGGQSQRDVLLASPISIRGMSLGGLGLVWVRLIAWGIVLAGLILVLVGRHRRVQRT